MTSAAEPQGKVLVAGVSGLVGRAVAERYADEPGWGVVGLSRRTAGAPAGVTAVAVDLSDPGACDAVVAQHPDVTHLVYAAVAELPGLSRGWHDPATIARNTAMLRNLMTALVRQAPALDHVTPMQGSKAYGIHLSGRLVAPAEPPLRERSARIEHPNFYFEQEALLNDLQRAASWGVTVFRPTVVYGEAWGANMNPMLPIAVLATLQAAADRPMPVPWPADRAPTYIEAVDATLLAEAILWAGHAPGARERTFNVTNGDLFVWDAVWPAIRRRVRARGRRARATVVRARRRDPRRGLGKARARARTRRAARPECLRRAQLLRLRRSDRDRPGCARPGTAQQHGRVPVGGLRWLPRHRGHVPSTGGAVATVRRDTATPPACTAARMKTRSLRAGHQDQRGTGSHR